MRNIWQYQRQRRGRVVSEDQFPSTYFYHFGDCVDQPHGIDHGWSLLTTGQYSGTTDVICDFLTKNTIGFESATKRITDSNSNLATIKTGDRLRVYGSTSNDGVYTVTTGSQATYCVVSEDLTDEAAGRQVTISKIATMTNNVVADGRTGLMWLRSPSTAVGSASTGTMVFYSAAFYWPIHTGTDVAMIASPATLRIVNGAAESYMYRPGHLLVCSGFTLGYNTKPGLRVTAVSVNGADLDLSVNAGNMGVSNEAAGQSVTIRTISNSIFSWLAYANLANLGGHSDWRAPTIQEAMTLCHYNNINGLPNGLYFTGFQTSTSLWTSTPRPGSVSTGMTVAFQYGTIVASSRTTQVYFVPVRDL